VLDGLGWVLFQDFGEVVVGEGEAVGESRNSMQGEKFRDVFKDYSYFLVGA
jgi:hypothetical protein